MLGAAGLHAGTHTLQNCVVATTLAECESLLSSFLLTSRLPRLIQLGVGGAPIRFQGWARERRPAHRQQALRVSRGAYLTHTRARSHSSYSTLIVFLVYNVCCCSLGGYAGAGKAVLGGARQLDLKSMQWIDLGGSLVSSSTTV